ncbi:MAG: alanine racemase C-terminal domain-containing protein, partial [Rhizobiaceae bacterium]|nr:alanine racemase C-terminal domain-containing protein [Rhizobiaceae bacterium]
GRPCAIHVDTGMNRLGLDMDEARALANDPAAIKKTGATLLMSHLACADDPDHPLNASQLENFRELTSLFKTPRPSFANSAAILSKPETHFELTRPGIAMYGGEAVNDIPNPMKPVVKAETRILQIRNSKKGDAVGYGAAHVLERDSKVAICSAGYADGYHRASSGCGVPLRGANSTGGFGQLGDHKVPLIGRVSMDLTAFDVTDVPDADLKNANWIELFGPNILVDDAARASGTIGYELLTGLGGRYQREYVR